MLRSLQGSSWRYRTCGYGNSISFLTFEGLYLCFLGFCRISVLISSSTVSRAFALWGEPLPLPISFLNLSLSKANCLIALSSIFGTGFSPVEFSRLFCSVASFPNVVSRTVGSVMPETRWRVGIVEAPKFHPEELYMGVNSTVLPNLFLFAFELWPVIPNLSFFTGYSDV